MPGRGNIKTDEERIEKLEQIVEHLIETVNHLIQVTNSIKVEYMKHNEENENVNH